MSELRRFAADDDRDLADLVDGLLARGSFEREADRVVERTVYDTFDWRLRAAHTQLAHEIERVPPRARAGAVPWLVWRSTDTGEVLGRIRVDEVPRFVWDLPAGPTTDRLAPLLEVRALLELITIRSELAGLRLRDREGKTEARVVVERATLRRPDGDVPLTPMVEIVPVRGYDRAAGWVSGLLAAQVVLRPVERDLVDEALVLAGMPPLAYSSKLDLSLDPSASALDAFVEVLRVLLDTMVANQRGTRADTDSEFLHDFRVAVRRTRSMLGMAGGVVPPALLGDLRGEFKWLGDVTTPTRDLDVYLLDFGEFEAAVAEGRRADLAPLRSFLVERQRQAHAQLVEALDSPRYAGLVARHREWLADPHAQPGADDPAEVPEAARPAREVAAARTWKAYRKLVRDGRLITPRSPAERLHNLRKDAKKLRYALECFGSLFDRHDIALGVKELKGVQDVLGTFQDCEVQKSSLEGFGEDMIAERGRSQAAALLAMGALVDQLDEREARARVGFDQRFAQFDQHHVRARFRRLFAPTPAGSEA